MDKNSKRRLQLNETAQCTIIFLPVCFYCLVTLRQRLWFVIRFWRYINLFVCMYVCNAENIGVTRVLNQSIWHFAGVGGHSPMFLLNISLCIHGMSTCGFEKCFERWICFILSFKHEKGKWMLRVPLSFPNRLLILLLGEMMLNRIREYTQHAIIIFL